MVEGAGDFVGPCGQAVQVPVRGLGQGDEDHLRRLDKPAAPVLTDEQVAYLLKGQALVQGLPGHPGLLPVGEGGRPDHVPLGVHAVFLGLNALDDGKGGLLPVLGDVLGAEDGNAGNVVDGLADLYGQGRRQSHRRVGVNGQNPGVRVVPHQLPHNRR